MSDYPVQCADCSAHLAIDPSGDIQGTACPECGGTRFFMNQPSPTQSDGTLRDMVDSDSQKDQGGNPLGEGTIMGGDAEQPLGKRDNYMHSNVNPTNSATKKVESMRPSTLNQEPYPTLWSDEHVAGKTAWNPLSIIPGAAETAGGLIGDAVPGLDFGPSEALTAEGLDTLGEEAGGSGIADAVGGGVKKFLGTGASHLMKGVLGQGSGAAGAAGQPGGMAPDAVNPAPNIMQFGSVDIPMILLADMDTPHSVKSIDEQHDDPEDQDQKEFNDGDKDPGNFENPNNEDSGMNGEDDTRSDASAQTGFAEDSPGIERMEMILPLLLHYFHSDESGQNDPVIKGLHDALEKEKPGYLNEKHPEGEHALQLIIEHGKQPPKAARVAVDMMSGGLPSVPTPGNTVSEYPQPGTDLPAQSAGGVCPQCGSPLAADGSCPQCGFKQHPQGGTAQAPAMGGAPSVNGLAGTFVGKVANGVGPQTPEQKAAVEQLLLNTGREQEIPEIESTPQKFWKELAEIQGGNNSTVPLVDPSQQPAQAPPPGMPPGGQPGAMPVMDPSQPGGGGGQPMMPMSHVADANNSVPRCPKCNCASTRIEGLGDNTGDGSSAFAKCPSCGNTFDPTKTSGLKLVALENPMVVNEDAADQTQIHPEEGQDPTQTWLDASGQPLMIGQIYELYSPSYPVPDEVQIVTKKPEELGVKLVGEVGNMQGSDGTPDFKIRPQDIQEKGYSFQPNQETKPEQADQPIGGTPGMEQIPQSPPTTDETSTTYPQGGATVSSVLMSSDEDPDDEDLCHKCGNTIIYHTASSETQTMHECDRCGSVWETRDDYEGREASTDMSWIMNDTGPSGDSFFDEMERAKASYGSQSRNIGSIAASDERYQRIKETLDTNKMQRAAGKHFSPAEQRGLINESGNARNSDMLDLSNTHYEERSRKDATGFDPRDPFNKNHGENAPDSHLVFGL
jgi:uncharacterized C2H2 Zn-finger protein